MTCWRACLRSSAALLLALLVAGPAQADDPPGKAAMNVDTLLDAFAHMPGLEASFVEEKHIAMLAKPLQSRGTLFFAHPGYLLRRVTAPRASEVAITPAQLTLRDADGNEKAIDLAARSDLRPFVESLVWILAGDRKALERVYALHFEPSDSEGPWTLTLAPKAPPLSQLIEHIRIRGEGLAVQQIEVLETAGNRTETRILKANPKRTFSAQERRSLFGATGKP